MCVPLGPRRRSRMSWGANSNHVCVEKITKTEVDGIIYGESFECLYQKDGTSTFKQYEGCLSNLSQILHDGKTRVKVAGSKTPGFKEGHKTVVMKAPCVGATILLRLY